jgi:RHS repeat-associated protein
VVAEGGGAPEGTPPPPGRIYANREAAGSWETFTIRRADGGSGLIGNDTQISLQSSGGYYVCAEGGGAPEGSPPPAGEMYANRLGVGSWETFTLVVHGPTGIDEGWKWVSSNPSPYSGAVSHQSNNVSGLHQHYFWGATQTLQVNAGDKLYTYVYLDPANPPSEVMLQWNDGSWEHRAYWGANNIVAGVDGTASRRNMGPLPPAGQWVRLEVEASAVGLEGKTLNGMAFTLDGGRASWDKAGKVSNSPLAGAGPPINNRVYTVDATTNRLTSVNGLAMGYDAAGNLTSDSMTGGIMTFDADNRLLTATNGGGGNYTYDGDGKRVKRITAGQEWWYVYGIGGELVAEYLASAPATLKKEYGYRGGQLLVVWNTDEPLADKKLKWLVTDLLGSTRMEADKSGSLAGITRHDYDPFGGEMYAGIRRNGSGQGQYGYEPPQSNVRQKFGSKERDGETGNDFFEARYYSPVQGRFTSVDPYDPINTGEDNASRDYYILQPSLQDKK